MGITNINEFLRRKCPDIFVSMSISEFSYKKVAWDISSHIYSSIIAGGRENNYWLYNIINIILCFKTFHIHAIPVFDGKSPPEKDLEKEFRLENRLKFAEKINSLKADFDKYRSTGEKTPSLIKEIKRLSAKNKKPTRMLKLSNGTAQNTDEKLVEEYLDDKLYEIKNNVVTGEDIDKIKMLFESFMIPTINAPEESEALCADMIRRKLVDAVLSPDSDCIAHRVPTWIKEFDTRDETCIVLNMDDLSQSLELNLEQIRDLCILCGTDYNRHIKNLKLVGPVKALKLLREHTSLENLETENKLPILDISKENGLLAKRHYELFGKTYPEITSVKAWDINLDVDKLKKVVETLGIKVDMDKINGLWGRRRKIIFEE